MRYVGIDLHKRFLVVAVEDERGRPRKARRFDCREVDKVRAFFKKLGPFSAVIEASTSYRWLYELLEPLGNVILAHPLRLRAIVSGRAKTDKLDAALLARLLEGERHRFQLARMFERGDPYPGAGDVALIDICLNNAIIGSRGVVGDAPEGIRRGVGCAATPRAETAGRGTFAQRGRASRGLPGEFGDALARSAREGRGEGVRGGHLSRAPVQVVAAAETASGEADREGAAGARVWNRHLDLRPCAAADLA